MMIKSDTLDKLKDKMVKIVVAINKAIDEKRPIWIRHHADCDGYCGAVALERVILKRLYDVVRRESDIYYYYRRYPTRTPFYDYTDAVKDVTHLLADKNRFNRKTPLMIVVDNGSSREDTLALQKLRIYDIQIIVIDHHPITADNDDYIDIHINPLQVGNNGGMTAGIICAEIAGMLDSEFADIELLAALAGVADRSDNPEMKQYLKLAEEKGYTKDKLMKIGQVFDYEARHIGYLESRFLVNDILFSEKTDKIVALVSKEIDDKKKKIQKAITKYIQTEEVNGKIIVKIPIDKITHRGKYPSGGTVSSITRDYLEEKLKKSVVALGYGQSFITFRISKDIKLDMNDVMKHLENKHSYALIEGGGHPKAGTIKFIEAGAEDVLSSTIEYIKEHI